MLKVQWLFSARICTHAVQLLLSCNTLQHTATYCNILQHTVAFTTWFPWRQSYEHQQSSSCQATLRLIVHRGYSWQKKIDESLEKTGRCAGVYVFAYMCMCVWVRARIKIEIFTLGVLFYSILFVLKYFCMGIQAAGDLLVKEGMFNNIYVFVYVCVYVVCMHTYKYTSTYAYTYMYIFICI